MTRHADQQDFYQRLEIRRVEQHVNELLALLVQVTVYRDDFSASTLPDLSPGLRWWCTLDFLASPTEVEIIAHPLSPHRASQRMTTNAFL